MVDTITGANKIFQQVEKIQIADMHHQAHEYFGLLGMVNVVNQVLPNSLVVSALKNLANNSQEVKNL